MEKIVYINYQPLTKKYYTDYYLDTCIEKGFEIEYWDITQIYFKNLKLKDTIDIKEIKKIFSFREFKVELAKADKNNTLFIVNLTFEFGVLKLFKILSTQKCKLAFFARGMYPFPFKSKTNKIFDILRTFNLTRMYLGLRNRFAYSLKIFGLIKPFDIIFCAGSEGILTVGSEYTIATKKSIKIDINYFDFDKYLTCKNIGPIIKENYCVYLDEYLPYHPDWEIMKIKTVTPKDYYTKINNFFDKIENKMNIEVVIAAHPKALRYEEENPFNGRKIIFGKACELVKDSLFTLTHHSTSISFPILFGKPIIFITSEAQKKVMQYFYELTIHMAHSVNSSVINFDSYKGEDFSLKVDRVKYDDYKYSYLTSQKSENTQSAYIFIDAISRL